MEKPIRTDDMNEIDWIKAQLDYKYWKMEFISGRRAYLRIQMAEFHNDESKTALAIDRLERQLIKLEMEEREQHNPILIQRRNDPKNRFRKFLETPHGIVVIEPCDTEEDKEEDV